MLPLRDEAGDRILHTYNGLSLNNPADTQGDTYLLDRVVPRTRIESVVERRSQADGLEVYGAYKRSKELVILGLVKAPTIGKLFDKIEDLAAAFDPALAAHDNPDEEGFIPYDFSVPTDDLVTYPTGLIACRYYARAREALDPDSSRFEGKSYKFTITLLAADPRRYLQSTEQLAGGGVADNGKATYPSWPTVTIAMTGAGSATFQIENQTVVRGLVLDLSGLVSGQSVAVDMLARTIKVDGVEDPSLYVSGDYWWMEPGSNTLAVTNPTNASATTVWRPAFSA